MINLGSRSVAQLAMLEYAARKLGELTDDFYIALPGHLNYGSVTQDRARIVLNRIRQLCKGGV